MMYPKHPERKYFFANIKHHHLFQLYGSKARDGKKSLIDYYAQTNDLEVIFFLINKGFGITDLVVKIFIDNLIKGNRVEHIIQAFKKETKRILSASLFDTVINYDYVNSLSDEEFCQLFNIIKPKNINSKNINPDDNYGLDLEKLQLLHNLAGINPNNSILQLLRFADISWNFDSVKDKFANGLKLYNSNKFVIEDTKLLHKIVLKVLSHTKLFESGGFELCEFNYDNINFHTVLDFRPHDLKNLSKLFFIKKQNLDITRMYQKYYIRRCREICYKQMTWENYAPDDIIKPMKEYGYDIFNDVDEDFNTLLHELAIQGIKQIELLDDGVYKFYTSNELVDLNYLLGLKHLNLRINIPNKQGITVLELIFKHHLKFDKSIGYYLEQIDWVKKNSDSKSFIDYIYTPIKLSEKRDNGLRYLMNLQQIDWAISLNIKTIMTDSRTLNYLLKSHVYTNSSNLVNLIKHLDTYDENVVFKVLKLLWSLEKNDWFQKDIVPKIKEIVDCVCKFNINPVEISNDIIMRSFLEIGLDRPIDIDIVYESWVSNPADTRASHLLNLLHKLWIYGIEFKRYLLSDVFTKLLNHKFSHTYDFNHKWKWDKNYGSIVSKPFVLADKYCHEINGNGGIDLLETLESDNLDKVTHTLCFGILDDLSFSEKKIIKCDSKISLEKAFKACWETLFFHSYLYWGYRSHPKSWKSELNELMNEKYSVWNQVEKYYVVCFGLNFETFDIWSRDCPKEQITW